MLSKPPKPSEGFQSQAKTKQQTRPPQNINIINNMKFAATSVLALALAAQEASGLSYTTGNSDNTVRDLTLKNRAYVPYGPDLTTDPIQDSSEVWSGYGYAMAAAEHIAYDPKEGYLYVQGEAGVSRSNCTSTV